MKNSVYPGREDCINILKENGTPAHVIRHCVAVSNVAEQVAVALNRTGLNLNVELVVSAALLHDIMRLKKDHAAKGAELLRSLGLFEVADTMENHMDHRFPDSVDDFTELDILCVGDRTVKEDVYVGFDRRMEDVMARYAEDELFIKLLSGRLEQSRKMIKQVEERIDMSIRELMGIPPAPLESFLLQVEKPGRYVGGELNSVYKDVSNCDLRFGLAFPDLYDIGMSWMGLQILYHLINGKERAYCERIFAPAQDFETLMRRNKLPLVTLETKTPVSTLDILGFTLQYELSYTNIINMLKLAGIPVRSSDRLDSGSYPILMAGGPCAFNPEPLAEVFDIFVLGDGEDVIPELCDLYMAHKGDKKGFLREAAALHGVYIPSYYRAEYGDDGKFRGLAKLDEIAPGVISKRITRNLDKAFIPEKPIVPLVETVQSRANVEIFRGCTRGCRFCQAGMIYRPVRERTQALIREKTMAQLQNTGYDELSLLSLSTSDYSGIEILVGALMEDCKKSNVALSIPSLRLDSFSLEMLKEIQGYKKTGLTFAPEAGTQRLRNVINKTITEDDILTAVREASRLGWNHVKFYFMIGLPTETQEDIEGIVEIAKRSVWEARGAQEKGYRSFSLTVSVSNFVPKPHTPFQWVAQEDQEQLFQKILFLKDKLSKVKAVKFQYHDTKASHVEALLARGDRRTLAALEKASELGCEFDSWQERFDYEKWMKAFELVGISTKCEGFGSEQALPWDHISPGPNKAFLLREWENAMSEVETRDCRDGCMACGVGICKKNERRVPAMGE